MWKLALLRLRTSRELSHRLRLERERADRLEIETRRQGMRLDALAQDLTTLSERLSRVEGRRLGGRPVRVQEDGQLPLADIPHGDKQALRRALGVVRVTPKE